MLLATRTTLGSTYPWKILMVYLYVSIGSSCVPTAHLRILLQINTFCLIGIQARSPISVRRHNNLVRRKLGPWSGKEPSCLGRRVHAAIHTILHHELLLASNIAQENWQVLSYVPKVEDWAQIAWHPGSTACMHIESKSSDSSWISQRFNWFNCNWFKLQVCNCNILRCVYFEEKKHWTGED